jgi:hypothetical protein
MLNRSKGRGPDERKPLVLQVRVGCVANNHTEENDMRFET